MIQGDKTGLGGGRGPGCICMGIWERKKSKGLILQTLHWVNKRNLARGLHTGLKASGTGHKAAAWIHNFCTAPPNSPSTCLYLLWSSFSVPWIKWKSPGSQSWGFSKHHSHWAVVPPMLLCMMSTAWWGLGLLWNSNKIKTLKPDWYKWYTQILHNIESVTLKEVFRFMFRWPKFYFSPCAFCVLIIKRWNQALWTVFLGAPGICIKILFYCSLVF